MGGLGSMLSALVAAQAFSGLVQPAVVIPYYAFLRAYDPQLVMTTSVDVPLGRKKQIRVNVPVYKLSWNVTSPGVQAVASHSKHVNLFLIGRGDRKPFHVAFHAEEPGQIYSARRPLKQEWKDLFFAKSVASFVDMMDESDSPGFDIVHLHGATNALVARFLGTARPATVYTLHDSLDEVEYSNLVTNVMHFDSDIDHTIAPYIHGKRLYTSALGIDLSDVTTFVSRTIARAMVEGGFDFALQELVMPSIYRKTQEGAFIGVSNGLDLSDSRKNPFTSAVLGQHQLLFSAHASQYANLKTKAKATLVAALPAQFVSGSEVDRPWLLFIGRYQYNKGCQFFEPLVQHLAAQRPKGARLIAMGSHNNHPRQELRDLAKHYADHFTLLDDESDFQSQYGPLVRMASDISFVPSFSEAFGLVAAEGLLFGMPVLTTGVGGLSEFISPITNELEGNAYVFDLNLDLGKQSFGFSLEYARPNMTRLKPAVESLLHVTDRVVADWYARQADEQANEQFTARMVRDALRLTWDRPGGPVEEVWEGLRPKH